MEYLDIAIEDPRWQEADIAPLAVRAVLATLDHLDIDAAFAEIGLLACDDARVATLNAEFRGKPRPTNVLSWPGEERAAMSPGGAPRAPVAGPDGLIPLGDIAIAYETCAREAREAGRPLADHVTHLLVHGLLHLLGYDHETGRDAALMEGLETEILGKLGLDDPYRDDRAF